MRQIIPKILLLIALVATIFVYQDGLYGAFTLDDHHTIGNNTRIAINELRFDTLRQAAESSTSGVLGRPLSMLSFAANHYLTGLQPFYFKLANLAIHLLNGLGLYLLTLLILTSYRLRSHLPRANFHVQWIALAVATAWLLHPFNLTGVLYVVQRMTSLAALFTIAGLVLFTWGRIRLQQGRGGIAAILISLLVFLPLAALSKENGLLLPLLMFTIEFTLFDFRQEKLRTRRFLALLYAATVLAPILAAGAYLLYHSTWLLGSYQTRDFSLGERLMTEARVMWFYLQQIVLPRTATMGLFHDDLEISRGLFQPWTTLISLTGLVTLLVAAIAARKTMPIAAFGLLFFLSGHLIESTVIPLEIAYEHRNYMPMYGVLLALFYYLLHPSTQLPGLKLRQFAAVLLIFLFAFNTWSRANDWSNPLTLARTEVAHHPASLRANAQMANAYAELRSRDPAADAEYYLLAHHHYTVMGQIDNRDINGLIGLIILDGARGKPLDPSLVPTLMKRLAAAPIPVNIGRLLETLASCKGQKRCALSDRDLEDMFQAALQNPNSTGLRRAAVFSAVSYYYGNVKNDYPAALDALNNALKTTPWIIQYRTTLISLLIALERYPEAEHQLAIARRLDTGRKHTIQLDEQATALLDRQKQKP